MITLLVIVVVAIAITSAGAILIMTNTQSTGHYQENVIALKTTESAMENAILRILRDPSYTGESLLVDGNTVMITVVGDNPKTVTAVGTVGQFTKQIEAVASYDEGIWTVTSWKETFE